MARARARAGRGLSPSEWFRLPYLAVVACLPSHPAESRDCSSAPHIPAPCRSRDAWHNQCSVSLCRLEPPVGQPPRSAPPVEASDEPASVRGLEGQQSRPPADLFLHDQLSPLQPHGDGARVEPGLLRRGRERLPAPPRPPLTTPDVRG